jgi:hypothetical protein
MKIDRGDVAGFVLGIVTSIIASWMWDVYREKQRKLEYSDKKIIQEMQSAIDGLQENIKQHINEKLS